MLTLPPTKIISQAAQALLERAGDTREKNAINKAELALKSGMTIADCADGWLVASTRNEHVYRVSNVYGCPCKAGASGKACYHKQAIEILIEAGQYTMPALPRSRVVYEPDVSEWF